MEQIRGLFVSPPPQPTPEPETYEESVVNQVKQAIGIEHITTPEGVQAYLSRQGLNVTLDACWDILKRLRQANVLMS